MILSRVRGCIKSECVRGFEVKFYPHTHTTDDGGHDDGSLRSRYELTHEEEIARASAF
jgi:hypothetical protein